MKKEQAENPTLPPQPKIMTIAQMIKKATSLKNQVNAEVGATSALLVISASAPSYSTLKDERATLQDELESMQKVVVKPFTQQWLSEEAATVRKAYKNDIDKFTDLLAECTDDMDRAVSKLKGQRLRLIAMHKAREDNHVE